MARAWYIAAADHSSQTSDNVFLNTWDLSGFFVIAVCQRSSVPLKKPVFFRSCFVLLIGNIDNSGGLYSIKDPAVVCIGLAGDSQNGDQQGV